MKILSGGNYTTNSGYAYQMRMFIAAAQRLGYEVVVFDIRAAGGAATAQIGETTILPAFLDPLGNDSIPAHAQRSNADVVMTWCDVWGFSPETMKHVNWIPVTPVDHVGVPPACINSLQSARGAIAISRFGQTELRKIGIEAMYMPHMLDGEVWTPVLKRDDMIIERRKINIPDDAFLVSFVGVNDSCPSRKGIPELLAAWSLFSREHPQALLYLHTTAQGNIPAGGWGNGVDIDTIIRTFDINPASILMPDEYRLKTGIPASELATVAHASDVFILPSRGEGFGIPLIEFQHAGCPIITTDFAAGAELCASGWLIDGEVEWSKQNATVLRPGIASIGERLGQAFTERGNMARRAQAHQFGRDFEKSFVTAKFITPTLAEIAQQIVLGQKAA